MHPASWARQPRRLALTRGLALVGGLMAGSALVGVRSVLAQPEQVAVSGGGVNVKLMPSPDGGAMVPLRESFGFDAHYAQCIIEDNPAAFAMDTFSMGRVVIEAHQFFMAMYSNEMSVVSIKRGEGGKRVAKLAGQLGCATYAGTGSVSLGSREATEPAFFEIEAVDGGHGSGRRRRHLRVHRVLRPEQAPLNHGIFGPKPTFTGEMVAGEVTVAAPVVLPLLE